MVALKDLLPPVKSTTSISYYDRCSDPWFKQFNTSEAKKSTKIRRKPAPPYLKRAGFVPRKVVDFGDGGAFPEIHIAQYPLDMGREKSSKPGSKILPVTVDAHGNVSYDAIVKQNYENAKKIVYSQQKDLMPKFLKNGEEDDMDDDDDEKKQKEIEETTRETKSSLEKIIDVRLRAAQPKNVPRKSSDAKFIKYKPSQRSAAFNSGEKERIIRMVEMPVDPLEPPKFMHKRVPKASGSAPVPVMHSPPRPLTVKDQQDWNIPPCISNWKNPKGYTIPLDKRVAADGGGLFQQVQISDKFAKLSEALYVAEQICGEEIKMRNKLRKEMRLKEEKRKEQELRVLAKKARSERTNNVAIIPPEKTSMEEDVEGREKNFPIMQERQERGKIREERRRERERKRRLAAKDAAMGNKKSKITRDRDRDVSEKVALGMASAKSGTEVTYDERLFNQGKGISSGFATDDQYNVYDSGLFTAHQTTLSTLYRPKKDTDSAAHEQLEKILKTERCKPYKGFAGTCERRGPRDKPVEFEDEEEADPFGLDKFLTEVKKGKKAMEKVGSGGTMKANGGSAMLDGYEGGSGRTRTGFQRGH